MNEQSVAPTNNAIPANANPSNDTQGQVQTGQNIITLPQRPDGFGPQYLDPGGWDFPNSDLDNAEDLSAEPGLATIGVFALSIIINARIPLNGYLAAFMLKAPASATTTPNPDIIPEFEVWDSSSISIKETATDLQRSLAINGFSTRSIEAALGGGAFGVSAGISADLKVEATEGKGDIGINADKEYYAAYNFPRARLFLDELNLEISPQCERELKNLQQDLTDRKQTDQKLRRFSELYGHIFATVFQLGGQLQSSKFAGSMLSTTDTERADALKAAVGASFGAQYVSGSTRYSRENQRSSQNHEQKISDLSNLAWIARRGNTLLCANPPQWASTVASHKNWRVIEVRLGTILHTYTQNLTLFLAREGYGPPEKLAWNELDTGTLIVAPTGSDVDVPEPVFTVLNANGAEKADRPILNSLPIDYPVFLVTGTSYERSPTKGNQIAGLYVNSSGQLKPERVQPNKINRFSFRLAGQRGPWKKHDMQPLQNLESGNQPPNSAVPVLYLKHEKKLAVPVPEGYTKSNDVQSIVEQYDHGTLTPKDRDVFEVKGYLDLTDRIEKIKPKKIVPGGQVGPVSTSVTIGPKISFGVGLSVGGVAARHYDVYEDEEFQNKMPLIPIMEAKSTLAMFTVFFEAV
ncbi:hypothetical protein N431DRAFT_487505 [Stipitochalara longipes BDJ]|nr:hypothetical protein N431DRAFT_487505 [Stipitochalara longipes BDJ]